MRKFESNQIVCEPIQDALLIAHEDQTRNSRKFRENDDKICISHTKVLK